MPIQSLEVASGNEAALQSRLKCRSEKDEEEASEAAWIVRRKAFGEELARLWGKSQSAEECRALGERAKADFVSDEKVHRMTKYYHSHHFQESVEEFLKNNDPAMRAAEDQRIRQAMASRYYHRRIVESLEEVKTKKGEPFYKLSLKGESTSYVVFRTVPDLAEGSEVFFDTLGILWRGKEKIDPDRIVAMPAPVVESAACEPPPAAIVTAPIVATVETKRLKASPHPPSVVVENAINLLMSRLNSTGNRLTGILGRRKWIVDCIVNRIVKEAGDSIYKKPEAYALRLEEFNGFQFQKDQYWDLIGHISLTDDEVRRATGREDLRGPEIKRLFSAVAKEAYFEGGESRSFWTGAEWHKVTVGDHLISVFSCDEYGRATNIRRIPAENKRKHEYKFYPGLVWSLLVLSNIANKKYRLFPQTFYKMSIQAQEIYRYASVFMDAPEGCCIPYANMCELLGYKSNVRRAARERAWRLRQILSYLAELRKLDVEAEERGQDEIYWTLKPRKKRLSAVKAASGAQL